MGSENKSIVFASGSTQRQKPHTVRCYPGGGGPARPKNTVPHVVSRRLHGAGIMHDTESVSRRLHGAGMNVSRRLHGAGMFTPR